MTKTVNKAQGAAYEFESPAEYLIATIGSTMFAEPKFYTDTKSVEELKNYQFTTEGLDEQAVKIIYACHDIATGDNPKDLLSLAHWARTEMNMRMTPQVMLAVAAHCLKTKPFVRKYVPQIAQRADEVRQVVGVYEHLFGWGAFPACLKKGVAERMSSLSEYEILKYDTKAHPTFADLLKFCDRRKNYPLSRPLRHYVLTGEVIVPSAIPMINARKALNSLEEWNDSVPALARRAGATWENLVSQFGSKKEVWEFAATQMGYMALLRNLANFLDADVSLETIDLVASKLSDPERVAKSKQLPFRFLAAYRVLQPREETYGIYRLMHQRTAVQRDKSTWNADKVRILAAAVESALECAIQSVPDMPGSTLIAVDNSGSMSNMLSGSATVTVRDVANTLCAVLNKRCDDVKVVSFGERLVPVTFNDGDSVLQRAGSIERQHNLGNGGHTTNAWRVFEYAYRNRAHYDRIVILSDMQCYDMTVNRRGVQNVAGELRRYREQVNEHCFTHFFDLLGQGTRQTESVSRLDNVVSGFSEKVFNQILVHESAESAVICGEEVTSDLPTLDYIRENY